MKKFITLMAAILSLAFSAPAQAHHTGDPVSNANKLGNAYNGHCGNGSSWACWAWPESSGSYPIGAHSWYAWWQWRELYLVPRSGSNWRLCRVTGRIEHDALVQIYEGEHCWWL